MDNEEGQLFRARIADDAGGARFLRTGDLGFVYKGKLYVVGRSKDLIIQHGRNIYPEDIEDTIIHVDTQIRPGRVAAFSIPDPAVSEGEKGAELFVVAAELRGVPDEEQLKDLASRIRSRLSEEHSVFTWAVVLLRSGTLEKTTSGKIRRGSCRDAYMSGELEGRILLDERFKGGGADS